MRELQTKLEERIFKDKSLLQEQLKNLLANGEDEDNHIVLGDDIVEEDVTSFLKDLSSANTIEEIRGVFSSLHKFGPFWYFPPFTAIEQNICLFSDITSHLNNVEFCKKLQTDAKEEKEKLEKEIADLEKESINLKQNAESLREQIQKALQE